MPVEQPLPAERHRRIEELIRRQHAVRVSALAEEFGVSEVTVRRDLEELEGRGVLERTHGGAVRARHLRAEPAYLEAIAQRAVEKRAIGRAAAALVEARDTIFLNGGTTTLEVFRHLEAPAVKVVTNHVGIALESVEREGLEVILVGGEYRAPSNSCTGPFATEALRRVNATRSFLGVEGLSLRAGLTTPAAPEAEIARVMIEQTRGPVTVVADSSKVGTVADFSIAPLEAVAALVTDEGIDPTYVEELEAAGVEVTVVSPLPSAAEEVRSG
jgi:DeoR family fructose operon transcriptional repressor